MNLTAKNRSGKIFLGDSEISEDEAKQLIEELESAIHDSRHEKAVKNFDLPKQIRKAANQYISECLFSYKEHGVDYDHGGAFGDWTWKFADKFKELDEQTLTNLFKYMIAKDEMMALAVNILAKELLDKGYYSLSLIKYIMTINEELHIVHFE